MKLRVAVAVIFDQKGRVLITRRPLHTSHGGMWEFPGGKLEADELPASALIREIKEEVGIVIQEYCFLGEVSHDYDSKTVELLVFSVTKHQGLAQRCEAQLDLRWVEINELDGYEFPVANVRIIKLIKETEVFFS